MDVDCESDIGQEIVEREQSNQFVAWVQARKELEADLYARLNAAPRKAQSDLRWTLSIEWAEWMRANPKPLEPVLVPGRRNLQAVPADHTGPRPFWGE